MRRPDTTCKPVPEVAFACRRVVLALYAMHKSDLLVRLLGQMEEMDG